MFHNLNMTINLKSLFLALGAILVFAPAEGTAEEAVPVRLSVAGQEFRGEHPVLSRGNEYLAPLQLLSTLGLKVEERKERLHVRGENPGGPAGELRLLRHDRVARFSLSELARLVDGEVHRPEATRAGQVVPIKPGDWVYLLARIRSIALRNGVVDIQTSFPVQLRAGHSDGKSSSQDYIECLGAQLPEGLVPEPVPSDETRIRSIVAKQVRPDLVLINLALAAPPGQDAKAAPVVPAGPPLLIEDVLRRVQTSYPKLGAADALRRVAAAKALEKAGAFDPFLSAGTDYIRYQDSDNPGKLKSFTSSDAGLELLTPYGIKVVTGARLNRGSVKAPLSLTGATGEYFAGVKIPILGGAGINEKAAALRQSRLGIPLADSEFDQFRLEVLLKAAQSYWDWVAAGQRLQVARDLLKLAQVRAAAVADRARAGDLPLIDITEADQEVQRRIEGLEKAERDLQKETFKLSLFLWEPDGRPAPLPTAAQLPVSPTPAGAPTDEQLLAARTEALERRPELQALEASRRIVEVSLDLARNQRLPALELTVAPGIDTGFDGAGPTLKAGISLGLPLRQRTAEGRIREARLKLEKIELDRQLERQRIVTEVEDAASAIRQAYQRYLAAAKELELARRLEEGERLRFELGDSTLFLVNQRERASAEAAVKVITLRAEYEQANAQFQAARAAL